MSAYLTFTIIGRRDRSREGTDEVKLEIRALAMPDLDTATWLLQEVYPSAVATNVAVNAAHKYQPITAKSLARTPLRRRER